MLPLDYFIMFMLGFGAGVLGMVLMRFADKEKNKKG